jgi:hypothetical protein
LNSKLKVLVPFLRVKRDWIASRPSLKPIHFPNAFSQNFDPPILFSIVEWFRYYVLWDIRHVNPHNYATGPLCFKTKCRFKINRKTLCLWLPIRPISNISRKTSGIKLKLLGILLLLLLLLKFNQIKRV